MAMVAALVAMLTSLVIVEPSRAQVQVVVVLQVVRWRILSVMGVQVGGNDD
jgi:hypothetical protein